MPVAVKAADIPTEKVDYQKIPEVLPGRAGEIVEQMSEEQLVQMATGDPGKDQGNALGSAGISVPGSAAETPLVAAEEPWNVASIALADGPAGLRLKKEYQVENGRIVPTDFLSALEGGFFATSKEKRGTSYYQYCTAIPVGTLLAQTWNLDLVRELGEMIGNEMELFGITLWLAPGMNIHRNPLCGRNFEYYSEDPLVAGMCAAADTRGIQSHAGIGTSIKHFAANNQEDNRMYVNEHISERAMREIYLKGFEIAVKTAQPMTIMSSYNLVNGVHTANSHDLLTAAARDEWGFAGYVMTDWGTSEDMSGLFAYKYNLKYGHSTSRECVLAGNDLQMPGQQGNRQEIVASVADGTLPLGQLQTCAYRILNVVLQSLAYDDCKPYGDQFDLEEAVTVTKA